MITGLEGKKGILLSMWFLVSLVVKGANTRLLGYHNSRVVCNSYMKQKSSYGVLKYYYTQKRAPPFHPRTNFNFMRVGHFFSDS